MIKTTVCFPFEKRNVNYIDFIWHGYSAHEHLTSITLPYVKHEVIFNFGDQFSMNNQADKAVTFISGLAKKPLQTAISGKYHTLGLMLNPTTFYQRFGIPLTVFEKYNEDLTSVIGKDIEALYERINNEILSENKIAIVKDFFSARHFKKEIPHAVRNFVTDTDTEYMQKGFVKNAAKKSGISSKHLINTFKNIYGCTPYHYVQLLHFNKALKELAENKNTRDYMSSFYDQSHFSRLFKQCSGLTTKDYQTAVFENRVSKTFAGTILHPG